MRTYVLSDIPVGGVGVFVDLSLCSLGSLSVMSISVIFDLANHLTKKQEMVHSSFYTKQLKTDQNSLSAYRKRLQKSGLSPNMVSEI